MTLFVVETVVSNRKGKHPSAVEEDSKVKPLASAELLPGGSGKHKVVVSRGKATRWTPTCIFVRSAMVPLRPRVNRMCVAPVIAWVLAAVGASFVSAPVVAQVSEPSEIHAYRITESIRIDGDLNEPAWEQATHIHNFTQRELSEGDPVTERTEVAILYDERNLYIGFWGYDRNPKGIIARKMQRDFDFDTDDNFEIIIDTYNDDRNGYLFVTNPNGAKADALVEDNGRRVNSDWEGVWYLDTRVTTEGWFAEFAIPFSTLKFRLLAEQSWGINFERNIRRKREQVLWQGWSRDSELEMVTRAGVLTGLQDLTSSNLLEFKPYLLAGLAKQHDLGRKNLFDVGGDINYLPSPALKLNLTVNPDFAQVESDRAQVNLTRFSLFFPEKREFFLEGRDFFEFNMGRRIYPFYSRRIGLDDQGFPVTILGGARLFGKFGRNTLGAMSLQTSELGDTPSTNFTVLRWKQDVLEESTVGIISTTKIQPGRVNTVYGADFHYATSRLFGDKNFAAGAALVGSFTSDEEVRTGTAQHLFLRFPNDFLEVDASWERAGPGFNPEVGFLRRRAYQTFYTEVQFNPRPKFIPWIQRAEVKPVDIHYSIDDHTREMQSFSAEFRPLGFETKNGEFVEFNIQRLAENLVEEFEISDGVVIPPGEYWFTRYEIQGSTFSGRPLSMRLRFSWNGFFDGDRTQLGTMLIWRTNKYLSLSADYQRNWISLPGGAFQVKEIGSRADFAFSPSLFGAVFGQWNSDDQRMLLNFRINWIPKPGTDLFFIVNRGVEMLDIGRRPASTTVAAKLVWRFAR